MDLEKYLVFVDDRGTDFSKVYEIEAHNTDEAEVLFARLFLPLVNFKYKEIKDIMENYDVYFHMVKVSEIVPLKCEISNA